MNKAITIILVILCSLLLWIDLVYKEKVDMCDMEVGTEQGYTKVAEYRLKECEDNCGIITDFKCLQK